MWLSTAELRSQYGADKVKDLEAQCGLSQANAIAFAEDRVRSRLLASYDSTDLPATEIESSSALKRVVAGMSMWAMWRLLDHLPEGHQAFRVRDESLGELADLAKNRESLFASPADPVLDASEPVILTTAGSDPSPLSLEVLEDW